MKVVFCQNKNDHNDDINNNYKWRQEFECDKLKHFLYANRLKYTYSIIYVVRKQMAKARQRGGVLIFCLAKLNAETISKLSNRAMAIKYY